MLPTELMKTHNVRWSGSPACSQTWKLNQLQPGGTCVEMGILTRYLLIDIAYIVMSQYSTCVFYSSFRYVVIVHPMKTRSWFTLGNTIKVILIVWLVALVLCSPLLHIMVSKGFITKSAFIKVLQAGVC